ncbi:MAG TPA: hypothetical protein VGO16_13705 [Pseudonocardiaceae bacterium]|nr:hypothetical protein [Pseudonocardiaceae bacterium]
MHSVPDPSRVGFDGPLASFAPGLAVELASLGYTTTSATVQMQLAASLSRWLDAVGVDLDELTGPVMERFLFERRARGTSHYSPRALAPIVDYLRRVGVVAAAVAPAPPVTAVEVLLERFARYLATQRALTLPVVRAYVHWVGPFTEDVLCPAGVDRVGEVSAGEVAAFLAARLPVMSRKSAQMTACALRSLLRFLHAEALVDAAPSVTSWRLSGLPQCWPGWPAPGPHWRVRDDPGVAAELVADYLRVRRSLGHKLECTQRLQIATSTTSRPTTRRRPPSSTLSGSPPHRSMPPHGGRHFGCQRSGASPSGPACRTRPCRCPRPHCYRPGRPGPRPPSTPPTRSRRCWPRPTGCVRESGRPPTAR